MFIKLRAFHSFYLLGNTMQNVFVSVKVIFRDFDRSRVILMSSEVYIRGKTCVMQLYSAHGGYYVARLDI